MSLPSCSWLHCLKSWSLHKIRCGSYGLILLDLGLPKQDGLSLLLKLRQRRDPTLVIIVTARDAVPDRVAGLDTGADDYLVKPFALEELLARIRVLTRRQSGRVDTTLHVGVLSLDPARHLVSLRGEEVAVTAREFALLHELMSDPDRVISRERLENSLYGWNEEIESNAVQVHVHNLRRKLGAHVIRNIRGVGYQIGETA
ncbi:winged helix-turn-helix domain-containing protein [Burkholderia sp. 8Y]|uniref:winged helix-turn-helix domain-containing protein n=1 Tax=Burkholderia sp. 8Y TaxID=2653133 RepID=UPI003FA42500